MLQSKKIISVVFLIVAITVAGGLFIPLPKASAKTKLSVSGAWALYPMMTVWADEYEKIHKDVSVTVFAGGAGKGSTDVLSGIVDIAMISRQAHPDEIEKGGVFLPVAKDAVVAVVSTNNPVLGGIKKKGITKEMFQRIWIKGDMTKWGELAGTSSKDAIRPYTRADSCGAAESWAKYLDGKQEDLKGTGVYGDPQLLDAVKKDKLGIGYNNYSYVFERKTGKTIPGISVVSIDVNGNGVVDKEELIATRGELLMAIKSGKYPHPPARLLYLMTKGEPKGPAKDFIMWILTDGQSLVNDTGFMKVPDEEMKASLDRLTGKTTTTPDAPKKEETKSK